MPEYKIYLVDYTDSADFSASKKSLLENRLRSLFESVINGHSDFSIRILWQLPANIQPTELVCYYVLNRSKSICRAKYSLHARSDGFTANSPRDGSLSEVYFNNWKEFPSFLADLTFHEFMHNKLEDPASTFHVHDDTTGFGSSVLRMDDSGVAEDNITTPEDERNIMHYSLTASNISQMFASLSVEVRQVIVSRQEFDRLMTPRRPRRR